MYPNVLTAFRASLSNEGYARWMYLDDLGLVTTGQGNLIDPMEEAMKLPWVEIDGELCQPYRISSSWQAVKARQELKTFGGLSSVFQKLTSIRLCDDGITQLVTTKRDAMIAVLESRLLCLCTAPADCQLAVLRWAWANGPHAEYPAMFEAIDGECYLKAAEEAVWKNENLSVKTLIDQLFANAQKVCDSGMDPHTLLWTP